MLKFSDKAKIALADGLISPSTDRDATLEYQTLSKTESVKCI